MTRKRFNGFPDSSYASMEREERQIALECFRTGDMVQGALHLDYALAFARCDGAELAERSLNHH